MKRILVGGEWVKPQSTTMMEIRNPATAAVLGKVADCAGADVDAAVAAARGAQRAWWKKPGVEKGVLLREAARKMRERTKALSTLMAQETGKPLIEAIDEIDWVAAAFEYYAEVGRAERGVSLPPVAPNQVNFTVKEPYGVVACIVPFNFPLLLLSWKMAPALAAGNTLVCKPPHQNPLSTLLFGECFDHLPPGVVNIITGGGATTGEALIRHEDVDMVAFTGSTEVGRHIARSCGESLKKVNLEMGGIDPLIVFDDADLNVAARGAAWARLLNAGQVCTSSKRFYVVASVADEFERRLLDHVKTLRLGDPMEADTDIGPLISEGAREKVTKQVERLKAEGAKLVYGGKPIQPQGLRGYFFEPTVFTGVRHGGIATTEEIFGPVISIIRVKDNAEAIEKANDSKYGLGCVVYTASLEWSMRAMENIKAGTFWINDPLTDNDAGPFGGMRWSGMGRELGAEGLDAFREPKHVHMEYVQDVKAYWFPYKDRPLPQH